MSPVRSSEEIRLRSRLASNKAISAMTHKTPDRESLGISAMSNQAPAKISIGLLS